MPYILWTTELDRPQGSPEGLVRILAIMDESPRTLDEVYASTGETERHTYNEFEKIVGRKAAEAALGRYFREQDKQADEETCGQADAA